MGPRLKDARKAASLTQEALAERIGVGTQLIKDYEAGRKKPGIDKLPLLAAALGRSVDWMLGLRESAAGLSLVPPSKAEPKVSASPTPEDRLGRLESVLERLVDELAATRQELQASREESKAARQATKALRKRLAATEAALAAPDLPSQAGAITPLRSTGSG